MAPHIVSWSDNEICMSPALSSAVSIVSFDSTFSDTYPSHLQMSPTASEAPGIPSADFGAQYTSLPGFPEEEKTPGSEHATSDDSFIQHDAYFFKDGNVTFLIDGTLYCVHRYFFARDSVYFSTRFAQLSIRDHEALPTIISLGDIERNDFEALLSVLYPANFEAHELTYEQWKSVLHLSTQWGFTSLRKLALNSIKLPTSHDRLVLARTYSVDHWVLPALTALCERTLPLSLSEARQMSMEDVILVARVREEIRGGALRVDVADIPRHVEVVLAEQRNRPMMGNDLYWGSPKSGTTGQDLDSTMAPGVDPNVEAEIAKTMGVASPSGPRQGTAKEGDTESGVEHSSKEVEQNRAVGATARPDAEAELNAETMCHPNAEAAKDPANVEEEARKKEHEEATRTKESVNTEGRKAAAEAKAKCGADLKAKAEAEARGRAGIEEKARKKQEEEAARAKIKADKKAKIAAKAKADAEAQKAAAAKKAKKAAKNANASNSK
ncbi:hypothetical protein EDB83DRAFT_2317098 [Lactarius deliciosus]|nr:hypothetical protein EDB83DRAFT_2317098 [Lactarius deliciosus]